MTHPDDLITASGLKVIIPGGDARLVTRDELEMALRQVLDEEDARTTAHALHPGGMPEEVHAWNDTVIVLVALLSDGHRARVRRHRGWTESEMQERIDAARPELERLRGRKSPRR